MDDASESDSGRPDPVLETEPKTDVTEAAAATRAARILSDTDRGRLQVVALLVAAFVSLYVIGELLAPFTPAIVTAGVMALLARPVQDRADRKVPNATASALIVTTLLFLLVLLPIAALSTFVALGLESGVSAITVQIEELFNEQGPAWEALVSSAQLVGVDEGSLSVALQDRVSELGSVLAGGTVGVLSGLGGWAIQAGVGLVTLFYLLRDGERFVDFLRWLIPLDLEVTDALLAKSREIVSATVFGTLVVAVVQGSLGGVLFWALGLPAPAMWGTVMAFFSLLPAVGPPVVWVPAAAILVLTGDIVRALVLVGVGGLIIGTIDNLLRSILVGDRAALHPLIVFFAVLGGLFVYGAVGFLLGPILVVIAISVLEIVRVIVYEEVEAEQPVGEV